MSTRSEFVRREEAAQLVRFINRTMGWRPVLHEGKAVFGVGLEVTPETVAAIGYERGVFGFNQAVPRRVALDAATILRGQAVLDAATTGGAR